MLNPGVVQNFKILQGRPNYLLNKGSFSKLAKYTLFYKQPLYRHVALAWQIAKQLSGYRKVELFLYNWCEIAANPTMHQNKAVSRLLLGKFGINDH